MDTDTRPHRSNSTTNSTSELFICFTSRLSSSSMKISSKSILSPGRARETSQISLSSSLSRRMRSNGNMKVGQASPMLTTSGNKKRGCVFENPEPSSPKVTCIGQVRVKTKKQGKKMRSRSNRRGEVSFRKLEHQNSTNNYTHSIEASNAYQFQQQECLPHRNQRWVHLPMAICEALREFNCFLPCKSSCMASEREKEGKAAGSSDNGSSCGAVFARWLVAVQEGEGKGARKIELVVGGKEDGTDNSTAMRSSQRRHVFEGIDIGDIKEGGVKCEDNASEIVEEARVSVCIPPKNALLLMRCRSDPVKMAALANRFWECPVPQDEDEEEKRDVEEEVNSNEGELVLDMGHITEEETCEISEEQELSPLQEVEQESPGIEAELKEIFDEQDEEYKEANDTVDEDVVLVTGISLIEDVIDQDNELEMDLLQDCHRHQQQQYESIHEEENLDKEAIIDDNMASISCSSLVSLQDQEQEASEDAAYEHEETTTTGEEPQEGPELNNLETNVPNPGLESMEREELEEECHKQQHEKERETSTTTTTTTGLPECLLLMMCEPKLSMEVSKETWVCSTDFVRWLPERPPPPPPPPQQIEAVKQMDGPDEPNKRLSIDSNNAALQHGNNIQLLQPPRSSCSFPAVPPIAAAQGVGGASMATMIEHKLVGSKAYEPFVLTRCKSEPIRSAAKLAPEACFWKNRKLEPHRPGTLGVGAAGVGF
ncbi:hypothetical protein CFOL_v3_07540 [Cephalotus follicularis]|uniref:Uncharacterized protein n=1 Tax=Cephalotus follicularis TaxID=3775 RepID=A0A1Q3B8B4_CEPFO|nr:hypothetical protein CFOL_v3_07540 [Cephalotus follicularis]